MLFKKYDVIIVGAGLSGLYAALNLDKRFKVLMLSKRGLTLCNSALAQGGIAAVMDRGSDDFELHIKDTLIAGGYENNRDNLRILVEHGPQNIKRLIELGVDFDKNPDGTVALTLEGGHSRNRIAHHKDSTGYEVVTSLIERVKALENVVCVENAYLLRLDKDGDNFLTEVMIDGRRCYYTTKICVLATGGIGGIYNYTTNSAIATGDGIQFAYNLGAKIKKLSLIQFHPTAFADRGEHECFLISEAARGEGAYLYNRDGERFMEKYEPQRKELSPRDVVSRCIIEEEKRIGSGEFYLDISHRDSEFVKKRFPMIYKRLMDKGYDLTKQPVPIYPCQHYLMGGIAVTECGATSVKGLYAAGECAYTGVHGVNRLASNSLLEALVFSRLVAEDINGLPLDTVNHGGDTLEISGYRDYGDVPIPGGMRGEIREMMQSSFFVTPNYSEAEKGLQKIAGFKDLLENGGFEITPEYVEVKSLATAAWLVLKDVMENR